MIKKKFSPVPHDFINGSNAFILNPIVCALSGSDAAIRVIKEKEKMLKRSYRGKTVEIYDSMSRDQIRKRLRELKILKRKIKRAAWQTARKEYNRKVQSEDENQYSYIIRM